MGAMDSREPLLTSEEIDAFFGTPLGDPLGDPLDDPLGNPPGDQQSSGFPEEEPEESGRGNVADTSSPAAEAPRPRWLKNQVADLADLVQALDLQARAHHAHVGISDELARLRQFTRTVGFVASPPQRGDQDVEIGTLTEEALGALAGRTPNAPRILFRRRGDRHETRADKSLIVCAVDAVLQTAIACCGSGDVVRVTVRGPRTNDMEPSPVVVEVEFPEGPLADLHPEEITAPYGLRKILPEIGANALAAAGAIAVGQGGDLRLTRADDQDQGQIKLRFELEFIAS